MQERGQRTEDGRWKTKAIVPSRVIASAVRRQSRAMFWITTPAARDDKLRCKTQEQDARKMTEDRGQKTEDRNKRIVTSHVIANVVKQSRAMFWITTPAARDDNLRCKTQEQDARKMTEDRGQKATEIVA